MLKIESFCKSQASYLHFRDYKKHSANILTLSSHLVKQIHYFKTPEFLPWLLLPQVIFKQHRIWSPYAWWSMPCQKGYLLVTPTFYTQIWFRCNLKTLIYILEIIKNTRQTYSRCQVIWSNKSTISKLQKTFLTPCP